MTKKKPRKIPLESAEIETWQPTRHGQPWVSMFRGLPMIFKGATESDVTRRADEWRAEQMEMEARKKANAAAASERMKARKAANNVGL